MVKFNKIPVLCAGVALLSSLWVHGRGNSGRDDSSPLRIERYADGTEYRWIDRHALDLNRVDYSDVFETYMTPIHDPETKDCTREFIEGKLQSDPDFFLSYISAEGNREFPMNGVLGQDFKRLEIYFYPGAVRTDSLTYSVKGRTKVKNNVCDFTGEFRIKKIYVSDDFYEDSSFIYSIIAEYSLREDATQEGCGEFRGIYGADGYSTKDAPGLIKVDDREDIADGYMNRSCVGTWRSYTNWNVVKRCMWGDYRLPFRFDFDYGDGEMRVNPKYASPEWDRYMERGDLEIIETENGDCYKYKNPWW